MKYLMVLVGVLLLAGCASTLSAFRSDVDATIAKYCDNPITARGKELCDNAKARLQEIREEVDKELEKEKAPE